jgi:glycosyltransferase involved in cell wall biosynthesis
LKQTYHNLEVLIIDDGSNDNTESLISNIKDSRIKYLKIKKNKGACFARNLGIKMSTGKYITFQDSDDYYHINKIEKQYLNLIKKKSDFDFCRFCIHFNNSYEIILPKVKQQKKIKRKKILEELCNGNFITTQSILVKRIFIKQILFDINFPRFQDYDLILRLI